MTSNRSFFKLQREFIRRNLILPVLSGVGFFFTLPLFTLMMIQHKLDYISNTDKNEVKVIISKLASDTLLSISHAGVKLGIIIMASLAAFVLFRYLHSSKQIDFFHSLPISRGNLFIQLYLTGFISVIPFYIIMYLVAVICAFAMGAGLYITAGLIFKTIIINIIYFLLFYSLAILAVILSGNTFISACIYAILNFAIPATSFMLVSLLELSLKTYNGSQLLEAIATKGFPILCYFENSAEFRTTSILIGTLIVSIILFALNKVLFTIRKSERAGSALSFYKTKAPLKCYLVLMCGYGLMFLFMSVAGFSWRYIGIFFGIVLAHAVFEALYNFDIRSLFKNWKTMIALLVVAFGFLTFLKADIIGYDKKIPNENDVIGVSFSAEYPDGGFRNYLNTFDYLTDTKNISTVLKLAQYGVDNLDNENLYNRTYTDEVVEYDAQYINIQYKLKNGTEMSRHYNVLSSDEYIGYLEDIMFTEEFMKNESYSIFDIPVDKLVKAEINVRTQSTPSNDVSGTIIDLNKATEIIKTLREESLTLTKEQAKNDIPVLRLDIDTSYYDDEYEGYMAGNFVDYVPVYSTYTKTLALISQYANVQPEPLNAEDIQGLEIYVYRDVKNNTNLDEQTREKLSKLTSEKDGSYLVTVTDKETISKIIENAILSEVTGSASPLFKTEKDYSIEVIAKYDINTTEVLFYPVGKYPIELLTNIILGSNQ